MSESISASTTGLTIRRMSRSKERVSSVDEQRELSILVDVSSCTGCKACEVACINWHNLAPPIASEEDLRAAGFSFQSAPDLSPNLLTLVSYREAQSEKGWTWFITKRQCMHCDDPGCLKVCPMPGAIVQYANGVVDFDHSKCISCRMCRTGCPFDIPRYDDKGHPFKCNFCLDRVANGLVPACVKACPTNALQFGRRSDMMKRGREIVTQVQARGFDKALLYASEGVGGAGYLYVLPHGDQVEHYGTLPKDLTVPRTISLQEDPWRHAALLAPSGLTLMSLVAGTLLHVLNAGAQIAAEGAKEERPSAPP